MNISKLFLLILIICLATSAPAISQDIDAVVSDLYESISFNQEKEPDYESFKSLFVDGARLISVKDTTSYKLTPTDYEKSITQQRQSGKIIAFEEKELHRETEQYGNILHVFSTYKTHVETPNETDSARGINSIQMMKEDGQWKVTSIIWYEEDNKHPLPDKYLPSNK